MYSPDVVGTLGNQILLIIAAIGTLVGVITNSIIALRTNGKVDAVATQVAAVETLANGTLSAERERVDLLTEQLRLSEPPQYDADGTPA